MLYLLRIEYKFKENVFLFSIVIEWMGQIDILRMQQKRFPENLHTKIMLSNQKLFSCYVLSNRLIYILLVYMSI